MFVSLAVNFFIIGAVVSYWAYHEHDVVHSKRFKKYGVSHHMDEHTKAAMKHMWLMYDGRIKPLGGAIRQAREETFTAMGAEQFNKVALEVALKRFIEVSMENQSAFNTAFIDVAADLKPMQRRRLFAAGIRRMNKKPLRVGMKDGLPSTID